MLNRFHLIPERNGQTDGQTDLLYQYRRVSMLTRDKNATNAQAQGYKPKSQNIFVSAGVHCTVNL